MTNSQRSTVGSGELETAISHSAWKHEQFAAVRGVGVCGMCGTGEAGVSGAGQAVGTIFCLVSWPSTKRERLTVPVPALASRAKVAADKCLAVPRAIPPALSTQELSREPWA